MARLIWATCNDSVFGQVARTGRADDELAFVADDEFGTRGGVRTFFDVNFGDPEP